VIRLGKKEVKTMLDQFTYVPPIELSPEFFTDWGDSRVYTIGDIGVGECAGEVVSLFSMEIAKAESEHFDALIALDEGDYALADQRA
jgi:sulfite reductase (ferredoxin)